MLVVGTLPKVPGLEDRQDLPDYLALMGYLVDALGSLRETFDILAKSDDYACVVLTLCINTSGDGYCLLDWLYANGRHTPCIVVDEGIFIPENRNHLRAYKNPVVEMLSPSDLANGMQPLLQLIRKHAPLGGPIVIVQPEPGVEVTQNQEEEKKTPPKPPNPWLKGLWYLLSLAGFLGCVRLAILVLDGAEKVSLNPMSAVAVLALLGGFFGIFRSHAARAAAFFLKLLRIPGKWGAGSGNAGDGGEAPGASG